jgi:hypothetical protein
LTSPFGVIVQMWLELFPESLQMVSKPLSSLRWGSVHNPMRTTSVHLLGRHEKSDPMRVASGDVGSQERVIVISHIAWV